MNLELFRKYLRSNSFERKLNYRLERLQTAEINPVERVAVLMDCKDDIFTFLDLFGLVYEPRLPENQDIPFFLFDYQKDVLLRVMDAEQKGEDLLIEKTRDMGATWLIIWYMLWRWLFNERWYGLIGSRKEEAVDDSGRTPQSLFGKLRYAYYSLPLWMRPAKFRKSEHDIHLKFINPDKMNFIAGESANADFGRQYRASFLAMDELFFWKFARESWRSSTDTSPCRVAISTAKPSSFARTLRESFKEQGKLITLTWNLHPFKDEEWFKKEQERRKSDPLSVGAELEIQYFSDPTLSYYPEVLNCPIRNIEYNPNLPLYLGLDFGSRDKSAIVYFQKDNTNFYCIDGMEKNNKPLSWYYPFLKQGIDFDKQEVYELENKFTHEKFTLKKSDYLSFELDLIKRFNSWKQPIMYCGEAAHRQKMIKSNTSIFQELAGIGIFLRINDMAIAHSVRRTATKKMLTRTIFADNSGALDVYDALANSVYPQSRETSTNPEGLDKPVHDQNADLRAAVENLAVNLITDTTPTKIIRYRR